MTAVNRAGGIAGRAEQGDIITYTWNEPIDPESLLSGMERRIARHGDGPALTGRWREHGFRLRKAAAGTLNFGTIYLQRNYVTATT